ncbi:MAG: ABC transporter permease [Polyangiaceae bacterium]|nr:ABC transporter permease [Polyangiaceae bacterium]MCB9608207.1 ABC transporter permease [Polyangiaceae bacterium]
MRGLLASKQAVVGLSLLLLFALIAIVGPYLVQDPTAFAGVPLEPPSGAHWLGTNGQGQDVLAQTIAGARMSLLVGFAVGFGVVAIGAVVGTAAGFFGGFIDDALSLLINVFLIMPGLPLMVVIAAYLPPGPVTIAWVLIFTGWAWGARVIRSQTLALRNKDFVSAAIVCGEHPLRIILWEILPNQSGLLVSSFIGATIYAIGAQVGLEFLGLGDVSQVTWGTNLYWASNDAALLTGSWWTFVPTGLCVALVGLALGLLNNAIDELSNPRLKRENAYERRMREAGVTSGGATAVLLKRRPSVPPAVDAVEALGGE